MDLRSLEHDDAARLRADDCSAPHSTAPHTGWHVALPHRSDVHRRKCTQLFALTLALCVCARTESNQTKITVRATAWGNVKARYCQTGGALCKGRTVARRRLRAAGVDEHAADVREPGGWQGGFDRYAPILRPDHRAEGTRLAPSSNDRDPHSLVYALAERSGSGNRVIVRRDVLCLRLASCVCVLRVRLVLAICRQSAGDERQICLRSRSSTRPRWVASLPRAQAARCSEPDASCMLCTRLLCGATLM